MRKIFNKIKKNLYINKSLFVFLIVFVIIGLLSGSIYALILNEGDKKMVFDYLNTFFENIKTKNINYDITSFNTIIFTLGLAIVIWLLGISVIGFFIIFFLLFLKSFILGFSVSSIILSFNLKGILIALAYVFPHLIINILIFVLLSGYGLIISFKIIRSFFKNQSLNFKSIFSRYCFVLIFSIFFLSITSLYEIYITPKLLSLLV